jgi:hypothetical protein
LNSKNPEEVRKRRAKASASRLNLYQKTILVAGVLTLFLAIGLSPQLAPFLAAAVAGGTLLLFLVFRNLKTKKGEQPKAAPGETFPVEEEALDPAPISSPVDGKMIADSPEVISEQKNPESLQEIIPPEPEESVTPPQPLPVEKEELSPVQEFSSDGVLSQIQERLAALEDKVAHLEDRVIDLAEKAASYQEAQLKSEPKIDLQSILSHLDEKEGKVV